MNKYSNSSEPIAFMKTNPKIISKINMDNPSFNKMMKTDTVTTVSPALAIGGIATGVLSGVNLIQSFVDLASLIRTDTEIKGQEVSVEEQALVAETFRAFRNTYKRDINLIYSSKFSPEMLSSKCKIKDTALNSDGTSTEQDKEVFCSDTFQLITELFEKKAEADQIILDDYYVSSTIEELTLQKQRAQKKIDDIEKKVEGLKDEMHKAAKAGEKKLIQKKIDRLESNNLAVSQNEQRTAESELKRIGKQKFFLDKLLVQNQQVEKLISEFTKLDEKTGNSEFLNYLKAENFKPVLAEKDSYWLEIKSIKAGGNNRTRKNFVLYLTGAKVDHSGGMIVEWQLYKPNGTTVDGNTDRHYEGYKSPKTVKNSAFRDKVVD